MTDSFGSNKKIIKSFYLSLTLCQKNALSGRYVDHSAKCRIYFDLGRML